MVSDGLARRIRALHRRKGREAEGLFLAEGARVVADLVEAGLPLRAAVVGPALEQDEVGRELAAGLAVRCPVHRVEERRLAELAATETPQGVLVVAEIPRHELGAFAPAGEAVVLVVDAVQDPGNLGTLVRTGEALGVAFVALLRGTVDPWNAKAVRAAAGSAFRLPIVQVGWSELLAWLRVNGFVVYGADAGGEVLGGAAAARAALVVGNEGAGLSAAVRATADKLVAVPLRGRADSLNVAAAAAILLHSLTERG